MCIPLQTDGRGGLAERSDSNDLRPPANPFWSSDLCDAPSSVTADVTIRVTGPSPPPGWTVSCLLAISDDEQPESTSLPVRFDPELGIIAREIDAELGNLRAEFRARSCTSRTRRSGWDC